MKQLKNVFNKASGKCQQNKLYDLQQASIKQ